MSINNLSDRTTNNRKPKAKTAKRINGSIKHDSVNASDFLRFDFRFACEDCSHFNLESKDCTLGYNTAWHMREYQLKSYQLSGKMALCRFLEID